MKKYIWPVTISGETWTQRRTKRIVNATVEGAGGAILRYMLSRPKSYEWYGAEVIGITPLGQTVKVIIEHKEATL